MRLRALSVLVFLVAACGGGAAQTQRPAVTSTPGSGPTAAPTAAGGLPTAAQLCGFLGSSDWGQFGYVTAAQPDVDSDGAGTAICGYANGLSLEVYVDATEDFAEATFQTILENAPFDGSQALPLPGADEVQFDPEIAEDGAGIAVRAGRVSFTIGVPTGDDAQIEATTLAALVLARSAALQ